MSLGEKGYHAASLQMFIPCWKFIFPSGSWFRPARKSVENHVAPPLWGHQCAVPRLLHPCRVVQGITVEMETRCRSKNWMPQNPMKTSNSSPKWQCFFFCIDKWTVSWLHSLHSPQKITEFARALTDFWMPWSLRLSASNLSPFGLTSARSRCRAVHIIGAGLGNSAVPGEVAVLWGVDRADRVFRRKWQSF